MFLKFRQNSSPILKCLPFLTFLPISIFFLLNLLYIGLGGHPVQINPVHSSLINIYPWFKKKKNGTFKCPFLR